MMARVYLAVLRIRLVLAVVAPLAVPACCVIARGAA
jgi:hypothetical protein